MSDQELALSMNRQEYCNHVVQEAMTAMKFALARAYGCLPFDLKDDERHTPALVQTSNEDLTLFLKLESAPLRITLGNFTHLAYAAGMAWDFHQSSEGQFARDAKELYSPEAQRAQEHSLRLK